MALNHIVNFSDGEALTHTDLNLTSKVLLRHVSGEFYTRLAANYAELNGTAFDDEYDIGFQAVGVRQPFTATPSAGQIDIGANRYYVALGESIDSGTDGEQCLMIVDITAHTKTVTVNGGGSPRTDILSIPATEAAAYAAYTSESRDFQDAVTGALSSQAQNKRYGWNVASLTYTQGAALPANHVMVAEFTVAPASTTAVLSKVGAIPMGAIRKTNISPGQFAINYGSWTETDVGITSTGAADANAMPMIPDGAFLIRARLYYSTGVNSGDFLLGLQATLYNQVNATSAAVSAFDTKDEGSAGNIAAGEIGNYVDISNIVWRQGYALKMDANGLDVRLRAVELNYIEH